MLARRSIVLGGLIALSAHDARADTDDGGVSADFPAAFNPTGVFCDGHCIKDYIPFFGELAMDCNFYGDTGAYPLMVWAVFNYDGQASETDYSFWGYDKNGNKFACYFEPEYSPKYIYLIGTNETDELRYNDGSSLRTIDDDGRDTGEDFLGSFIQGNGEGDVLEGGYASTYDGGFDYCPATGWYGVVDLICGGDCDESSLVDQGDDINGHEGPDFVLGEEGPDEILGGPGEDCIRGGPGADIIDGGADSDRILGDSEGDTIHGGLAVDGIQGGTGNDTLYGDEDADRLNGNDGNDTVYGGPGGDYICGGATSGGGYDTLNGGYGNWDFIYEPATSNAPSGTDPGGTDTHCGHVSFGSFLTSGSCTYDLDDDDYCPTTSDYPW